MASVVNHTTGVIALLGDTATVRKATDGMELSRYLVC